MKTIIWTCEECLYSNRVNISDIDEPDTELLLDVTMHRDDHDMIEDGQMPSNPTVAQIMIQLKLKSK